MPFSGTRDRSARAQSRGAGVRGIKQVSRLRMRNVHGAIAQRSTRVGPAISSDVGAAELERPTEVVRAKLSVRYASQVVDVRHFAYNVHRVPAHSSYI